MCNLVGVPKLLPIWTSLDFSSLTQTSPSPFHFSCIRDPVGAGRSRCDRLNIGDLICSHLDTTCLMLSSFWTSACLFQNVVTASRCHMSWAWEEAMNHGPWHFLHKCRQSGQNASQLGGPWRWRWVNAIHRQSSCSNNPSNSNSSSPQKEVEDWFLCSNIIILLCRYAKCHWRIPYT